MGLDPRNGRAIVEAKVKLDWMLVIISEIPRSSRPCDVLASNLAQRMSPLEATGKKTAY